jgi:fumarate reductase subunit D
MFTLDLWVTLANMEYKLHDLGLSVLEIELSCYDVMHIVT